MADPIAAIGIGATLASGFVNAAGDLFGGAAQGKMYEYQAGVARMRSQVAEQNARWAVNTGETNAQISGMHTRFQVGQIRAGQGASNIAVSSPSSTGVRAGQTEVGQIDESVIRTNAARRAYGSEVESASAAAEAGALSTASATARTASYYSAASSILGGAGNVSSKWLQASQAGVPGFGGGARTTSPTGQEYLGS